MSDKKISELTAASALTGSELVETVQGGINKQTTTQDIADLGGGAVDSVNGETGVVVLNAADVGADPSGSAAAALATANANIDNVNANLSGEMARIPWKPFVDVMTTTALPACTYDSVNFTLTADVNGALPSQDGQAANLAGFASILVNNQSDQKQNLPYDVLDYGGVGSKWVLQVDALSRSLLTKATVRVRLGTANGGKTMVQQNVVTTPGLQNATWVDDSASIKSYIDTQVANIGSITKIYAYQNFK